MRRIVTGAAALAAFAVAGPALAQSMPSMGSIRSAAAQAQAVIEEVRYQAEDKTWAEIARKPLAADLETDRIEIPGDKKYGKLRICLFKAALDMKQLAIAFHNGTEQRIAINRSIGADNCTSNLDLEGKGRQIDAVELTFAKTVAGSEPEVVVQAR